MLDAAAGKIRRKVRERVAPLPIRGQSLLLPAVFFGYGALTLRNGALQDLNRAIKRELWDKNPRTVRREYEDFMILAPVAMTYVLNLTGVKSHNNFVDRGLLFLLSGGLAAGISGGLKALHLEERPNGANRESFPSGHTTTAFASAEYARLEYRGITPWPGIAAYACALTAGFLRIYNNQHWFSDIVAGAGVGIFSARLAYYYYPRLKKFLFGTPPLPAGMSLWPTWDPASRQAGFSLHYRF